MHAGSTLSLYTHSSSHGSGAQSQDQQKEESRRHRDGDRDQQVLCHRDVLESILEMDAQVWTQGCLHAQSEFFFSDGWLVAMEKLTRVCVAAPGVGQGSRRDTSVAFLCSSTHTVAYLFQHLLPILDGTLSVGQSLRGLT